MTKKTAIIFLSSLFVAGSFIACGGSGDSKTQLSAQKPIKDDSGAQNARSTALVNTDTKLYVNVGTAEKKELVPYKEARQDATGSVPASAPIIVR